MDNKIELPYFQNFISEEQEKEILRLINQKPAKGKERNQIVRYGSKIPYAPYNVSGEIPDVLHSLNISHSFDHVTINEYHQGQSIEYHFDLPFAGEKISIISLLGKADMLFRNAKDNSDILKFNVEPRSLLIMQDRLRWQYEHSAIAHELRYSVVFRDSRVITRTNQPILCNLCKCYHQRSETCY
jgi:alkylated DNA repair dioxygenase AlkB